VGDGMGVGDGLGAGAADGMQPAPIRSTEPIVKAKSFFIPNTRRQQNPIPKQVEQIRFRTHYQKAWW
jgi:hypothetical protein